MSVVIAYSCKDFSIIATDTLVTYSLGYQEDSDDKIKQIHKQGMGFLSGTGSAEVKETVYDYLSKASEEDMKALLKSTYQASFGDREANVVISCMTKVGPAVILMLSNGDFGAIEQDKFLILPPSDIPENKFPTFIADSLEYNYDGNFNMFLIKMGEFFSYFPGNSRYVSQKIRCGLHYYLNDITNNTRRREWSHSHISEMIENAKNKAYTIIEYEVNTHTHYKKGVHVGDRTKRI